MMTLDTMLTQHRSLAFTIFFHTSKILQYLDGPVVTALTSHQLGLGSIPARFEMWVEFVVCSHLEDLHENQLQGDLASSLNNVIHVFILLFLKVFCPKNTTRHEYHHEISKLYIFPELL